MKRQITRYTCDAPDCEDTFDIEGPPDSPTLQSLSAPAELPDGWIELKVAGSSPGGEQQLVHASKPECAAKLAEDQVEKAVEAAEQRKAEEEEQRERAEKAAEEAQEATEANVAEQEAGGAEVG